MNQFFEVKTKGKVLYQNKNLLYKSINNQIFCSKDNGDTWSFMYKLKAESLYEHVIYRSPILCRLLRKGIHSLNAHSNRVLGLIFDKSASILEKDIRIQPVSYRGSRPLSFEKIEDEFIFGEYRSNPERSKIRIYSLSLEGKLKIKAEMSGIRHIHGIYQDPYTKNLWITTGDEDTEAALYRTDSDIRNVTRVLHGSQQTRAIKLLFDREFIYYGSDAPHEVNYLYRMNKETLQVEKLIQVGSSVFHGYKVKNWLFFSTAIEPSRVNSTKHAELWASPDGLHWKCVLKVKKDIFPMILFQYGQIFFPNGPGGDDDVWISLFATRGSNYSFKLNIQEIERVFHRDVNIRFKD